MPVIPALWGRGKELGVHSHSQLYGKFEDWTVWDTQTLYQEASTQSPLRHILCSSPFESIFTRPLLVLWTCLLFSTLRPFFHWLYAAAQHGWITVLHYCTFQQSILCINSVYKYVHRLAHLAFINNKSSELKTLLKIVFSPSS